MGGRRLRRLRTMEYAVGSTATRPSPTRVRGPGRGRLLPHGSPAVDAGAFRHVGCGGPRRATPRAGRRDRPWGLRGDGAPAFADPVDPGPRHLRGRPHVDQLEHGWGPPEIDRSNGERASGRRHAARDRHLPSTTASAPMRPRGLLSAGRPVFALPCGRGTRRRGGRHPGSVAFEVWGDGDDLGTPAAPPAAPQAAVLIAADLDGEGVRARSRVSRPPATARPTIWMRHRGNARLACSALEKPWRSLIDRCRVPPEEADDLAHRRLAIHAADGPRRERAARVRDLEAILERVAGGIEARYPASNASPAPVVSSASTVGPPARTSRSPWAAYYLLGPRLRDDDAGALWASHRTASSSRPRPRCGWPRSRSAGRCRCGRAGRAGRRRTVRPGPSWGRRGGGAVGPDAVQQRGEFRGEALRQEVDELTWMCRARSRRAGSISSSEVRDRPRVGEDGAVVRPGEHDGDAGRRAPRRR